MTILTTQRLIVRQVRPEDAPVMYGYSREENFRRELPDQVLASLKQAEAKVHYYRRWYREKALPLLYAVEQLDTGKMIGHVELGKIPEGVEIGCAISARHQGNGFAGEMVRPFCDWAKAYLQAERLYGLAKEENIPAWRVLERSGFQMLRKETRNFWGKWYLFRVYTY